MSRENAPITEAQLEEELRAAARATEVPPGFRDELMGKLHVRAAPRRKRWPLLFTVAIAAPAFAAALFFLIPVAPEPFTGNEYGIRGETEVAHAPVALRVFEVKPGAKPRLVLDSIRQSSGLLFAYSMSLDTEFSWIAILALDAAGGIHRLIPGEDAGSRASVAAKRSEEFVSIRDGVRPSFAPGPAKIVAVFSRRALGFDRLQEWLADGATGELPDAAIRALNVDVRP